ALQGSDHFVNLPRLVLEPFDPFGRAIGCASQCVASPHLRLFQQQQERPAEQSIAVWRDLIHHQNHPKCGPLTAPSRNSTSNTITTMNSGSAGPYQPRRAPPAPPSSNTTSTTITIVIIASASDPPPRLCPMRPGRRRYRSQPAPT